MRFANQVFEHVMIPIPVKPGSDMQADSSGIVVIVNRYQ